MPPAAAALPAAATAASAALPAAAAALPAVASAAVPAAAAASTLPLWLQASLQGLQAVGAGAKLLGPRSPLVTGDIQELPGLAQQIGMPFGSESAIRQVFRSSRAPDLPPGFEEGGVLDEYMRDRGVGYR